MLAFKPLLYKNLLSLKIEKGSYLENQICEFALKLFKSSLISFVAVYRA